MITIDRKDKPVLSGTFKSMPNGSTYIGESGNPCIKISDHTIMVFYGDRPRPDINSVDRDYQNDTFDYCDLNITYSTIGDGQ